MADPTTNLTDEERQRLLASTSQPIIPSLHSIPPLPATQQANLMSGTKVAPQVGKEMFAAGMPSVSAAPGTADYGTQRQEKLDYEKLHPWGSPVSAQPGTWGKIGHIASRIGNIAGDILAPGITANIPGSDLNKQREAATNAKWINLGSENELRGAQTEKAKANVPLEQEQVKNLQSEEEARLHPKQPAQKEEVWKVVPGIQGPNGEPIQEEQNSGQTRMVPMAGASVTEKPQRPEAPHTVEMGNRTFQYNPDTKKWDDIGPMKAPPSEPGNYVPFTDAQGNTVGAIDWKTGHIRRADQVPGLAGVAGMQGPGGVSIPPKPTSQTQNMAQMAQTVLPMANNLIAEVGQLKGSIGPAVGRWNQLMVNKGGKDFPEFAGLDTDLDLFASALVRTHFGARGGQGYREELKKQFNEAQSPEDLINRIQHADEWIKGYANMGGRGAPPQTTGGGAAPAGGKKGDPLGIY